MIFGFLEYLKEPFLDKAKKKRKKTKKKKLSFLVLKQVLHEKEYEGRD